MTTSEPTNSAAWKTVSREDRREVFRLANSGQQHSDPAVAEAAYEWSHRSSWNGLANRLPGWLLPAIGAVLVVLFIVIHMPPYLVVGAVAVMIFGLLGWLSTTAAAKVRAAYAADLDAGRRRSSE
jgi:Flp pilus assembly protein TadB